MTSTLDMESARDRRLAAIRTALPSHLERLTWDQKRIATHQRDMLRVLLRHALAHSPFHGARLAGIDPDRFELGDLSTLPTMTKREMMASYESVVTDPRLTREVVEEHLVGTGSDASELFGEYVVLASGGSSGERGVFAYSREAAPNLMLGLARPGMKRLLASGEPPPGGWSMAMVAAASAIHASRAVASLFSGEPVAVTSISATQPLQTIVDELNSVQPTVLQGYPSVLRQLADEQTAGRLRIAPRAINAIGEHLTIETRTRVGAAFGVAVGDGYGSSEGVVGACAPDDPVIVLASDLAIVELVDDDNRPVPPGTPSAKALITNLYNTAQPLIRYELNDRLVREPDAPDHGHLRVTIEGCADDTLRYGDVTVHPLAIRSTLLAVPAIVEYQVTQTHRGVHVDVVAPDGIDEASLSRSLRSALDGAGLAGPEVTVTSIESVERNTASGKIRRFVLLPDSS